ncbi:hypothetical protein E2C01_076594 [Portunus trituberculatus]|uniref:Uncharacterized protein n=1 Tax=Portunus trituberculatus TaxID=210409 RepID=A0A5B7IDL5_PORTR|nr:hypothetical protein [Portunus trituberculatus]
MAVSVRVLAMAVGLVAGVQASTHHSTTTSTHPSTRPWAHLLQEVIFPPGGGPRVMRAVLGMGHDALLPRRPHIPPINDHSAAHVFPEDVQLPHSATSPPPVALSGEKDTGLEYFVPASAYVVDSHAAADDATNVPTSVLFSASFSAFNDTSASDASTSSSASSVPSMHASFTAYHNASTSTTTNATPATASLTRKWRLMMSLDGALNLQEPDGVPWGVARPLGNLRKTRRSNVGRDEVVRRKREVEMEEEGGFVSSIVKSFSANVLWVKIVSDQAIGIVFTLVSSVAFYVLHIIGLGHIISTGELIGVLWAIYDAKVVFVAWLLERGYLV